MKHGNRKSPELNGGFYFFLGKSSKSMADGKHVDPPSSFGLAPGEEGACTPRVLWPEPFPANHVADHVAADLGVGTGYFTDGGHPTNCNW